MQTLIDPLVADTVNNLDDNLRDDASLSRDHAECLTLIGISKLSYS